MDKWQLSPASQLKQLKAHTLSDGRVQVISVVYLLIYLLVNFMIVEISFC